MMAPMGWTALLPAALALALPAGTAEMPPSTADAVTGASGPHTAEIRPSATDIALTGASRPDTADLRDPEIIRTEDFTMRLGVRVQVQYSHLDPETGGTDNTFRIRRGRLALGGSAYEHFDYAIQLELAGGSARLIDANVRWDLAPMATLWLGQGKAFFGRQQLTSSGALQFVDRTIADGRFVPGRQAGVGLLGRSGGGSFEYNAGIYNGTGINTPNDNNRFLTVARAVWTPLGPYEPVESAHDRPDSPRMALGAAGMRTTEGTGEAQVRIARLGMEGAFKVRGLSAVAEFYREGARPRGLDRVRTDGWYVQAGYLLPRGRNEVAARYAVISPEVEGERVEWGAAVSHYLREHRAKIQADLRTLEQRATGASDLEFRVQLQLAL